MVAAAALLALSIDFENRDLSGWILPRVADWQIASEGDNHFLRLRTAGDIGEPRRPLQYAIRKDLCLGDFTLRVKVRRARNSLLVVFGYQDTLHFYYAHLSADSGGHGVHNGLFKVDGGERFRIGGEGPRPVLPDQEWRDRADGPFRFGRIGLGSFNETGDFDDLRVEGRSSPACR